ncbi:MAG: hypothetical protein U0269_25725 [Polyangiales bacterium]
MNRSLCCLVVGALLSCSARPNTVIVLDLTSDIDPVVLRRLQLAVRWTDSGESAARERSYVLREDGTRGVLHTFPASLVVAPEGASDGREAEFSLLAMTDGANAGSEELFTVTRVRARFRAGQTLRVPVFLAALCGETSVGRTCSPAQTCVADTVARCVSTPSVEPGPYVPPDVSSVDASSALRPLTGVVELRAGHERTCARLRDGRWHCWGEGSLGQLGNRRVEDSALPVPMNLGLLPTDVALGRCHSCAQSDDRALWCFGCNSSTQVSPTRSLFELAPVRVGADAWVSVSSGVDFSCGIHANGRVFCWGSNEYRQLGPTSVGASNSAPIEVELAPGERFVSVSAGATHACAVTEAGVVYCWGSNARDESSTRDETHRVTDPGRYSSVGSAQDAGVSDGGSMDPLVDFLHNARSVHCADHISCAVLRSGAALCWGAAGSIGSARSVQFSGAFPVTSLRGPISVRSISTSSNTTVAITTDGRAMCWGSNEFGQCGVASGVRLLGAIDLAFARPVLSIVSGGAHVCALLDDTSVHCLGANFAGQLGNGTRSAANALSAIPQPVLTDRSP